MSFDLDDINYQSLSQWFGLEGEGPIDLGNVVVMNKEEFQALGRVADAVYIFILLFYT